MAFGHTGYTRVEAEPDRTSTSNHDDIPRGADLSDCDGHSILSTKEERKRTWFRNAVVNGILMAIWFIIAIALSVYNKWMFSPNRYGFQWPLFVTMFHMFVQFGYASLARNLWAETFRPPHNPTRKDYGLKVIPTAVASGLDIGLSNLSLKIVTLSFYTMCKSSSLIFVLLFAFMFRLEKFSFRLIGVIFLIFVGVLMMVTTKTQFVLIGFILVTSASALGGLRWSLTQLLLKDKELGMNNPAATIFWLAPMMGLSLAVVSISLEDWRSIFASKFFDSYASTLTTTVFIVIPGTMAFLMILTEYTIIHRAGVVPMSIAGIAKEVAQISVSAWLFGDRLSGINIIGVIVTACGIALFTYHKFRKSVDPEGSDDLKESDTSVLDERIDERPPLELDERNALPLEPAVDTEQAEPPANHARIC